MNLTKQRFRELAYEIRQPEAGTKDCSKIKGSLPEFKMFAQLFNHTRTSGGDHSFGPMHG